MSSLKICCNKCGQAPKGSNALRNCKNAYCDCKYCANCFSAQSFTRACCGRDRCVGCDAMEKKREMFYMDCRMTYMNKRQRNRSLALMDTKDPIDVKAAKDAKDAKDAKTMEQMNNKLCCICGDRVCICCVMRCNKCFPKDKYYSSDMCRKCAIGSHYNHIACVMCHRKNVRQGCTFCTQCKQPVCSSPNCSVLACQSCGFGFPHTGKGIVTPPKHWPDQVQVRVESESSHARTVATIVDASATDKTLTTSAIVTAARTSLEAKTVDATSGFTDTATTLLTRTSPGAPFTFTSAEPDVRSSHVCLKCAANEPPQSHTLTCAICDHDYALANQALPPLNPASHGLVSPKEFKMQCAAQAQVQAQSGGDHQQQRVARTLICNARKDRVCLFCSSTNHVQTLQIACNHNNDRDHSHHSILKNHGGRTENACAMTTHLLICCRCARILVENKQVLHDLLVAVRSVSQKPSKLSWGSQWWIRNSKKSKASYHLLGATGAISCDQGSLSRIKALFSVCHDSSCSSRGVGSGAGIGMFYCTSLSHRTHCRSCRLSFCLRHCDYWCKEKCHPGVTESLGKWFTTDCTGVVLLYVRGRVSALARGEGRA